MEFRPRLLLIGDSPGPLRDALAGAEVEAGPPDPADAARRLAAGGFAGVVAAPAVAAGLFDRFRRDELIVAHIDRGLAVLDPAGTVVWANPVLAACCDRDPVGRPLFEALGAAVLCETSAHARLADTPDDPPPGDDEAFAAPHLDPFGPARRGQPVALRVHRPAHPRLPYLEADIHPARDPGGAVTRLVALVRNVTPEVAQQQKLDALHAAGRELAGLAADQLSEMNVPTRVELLKANLRRYVRDLLRYDTIEVRLLDRKTGELRPLLADGMTPEAADRPLTARVTGNGVTGYVAATGRSYLCPDTAADPLYLRGAEGARSSLTVPLVYQDEVIGTLNVESPRPNAFGPADLQFTELFSREVANALHTLDLLSAQQVCTVSQSIDAVNREIALPLDDVLAAASVLLARLRATDPEGAALLHRVLDQARAVKDRVQAVGRDLAAGADGAAPLAGRRVLVLDPDERTRRSAHLLMTRLGATVETAGTATEAVALAADNSFDAVLMDIRPPDLGGYETYRRLRAARPAASVAMTTGFGYDAAHSIVKARADGLRHVLFKPFRQDQLVKAVLDGPPSGKPAERPEVAST